MRFLSLFKELWFDFLFPKKNDVLVLESLTPEKLLAILPQAQRLDEEHTLALFDYSHQVVKEIVWEIKYGGNRTLASTMGKLLYDTIIAELHERNIFEKEQKILLIPMPTSDKRRFERGWNQAELLAQGIKECDKARQMKYLAGQLAKVRHTESQTRTASKKERRENLKDSMRIIHPDSVAGKFVVLVDDVVTTGSTFAEARRALREARVNKILCIALAH